MRAFVSMRMGNSESVEIVQTADGLVLSIRERGNRQVLSLAMNEYQAGDLKRAMAQVPTKERRK